jgi:aspartate carbamoyltransferase regulatory subunit
MNVHIVEKKNLKCKFCHKGFRAKADLAKHMRRNVHTVNELDDGLKASPLTNKFHCLYCDRSYYGKQILVAHMRKEHP